ncbi:MAG: protoheme IX farnesyltransferase [Gammaproteobacteria bacterium]|nr:MAG: protoheme IX farnesyltransferase [Gammaproteobacteria bacterium]
MPIRADCAPAPPALWRRYLELTKPKVVALITFTAVVGTLLASPGLPPLDALVWGNLGIALAAASAAAINHVLDRRIDAQMARTRARPLPTGALSEREALAFAALLGVGSMGVLAFLVNLLTAVLTFLSLIGYAVVYTVWLKRATPQNIVIGGTAGAAPPVLGWAAVSDSIDPNALLLALIIFVWTPPHFWALAIYLAAALLLNAGFLYYALALKMTAREELPLRVFRFSVTYLMWLFAALLVDHYLPALRAGGP